METWASKVWACREWSGDCRGGDGAVEIQSGPVNDWTGPADPLPVPILGPQSLPRPPPGSSRRVLVVLPHLTLLLPGGGGAGSGGRGLGLPPPPMQQKTCVCTHRHPSDAIEWSGIPTPIPGKPAQTQHLAAGPHPPAAGRVRWPSLLGG